jgi:hypothetical protein
MTCDFFKMYNFSIFCKIEKFGVLKYNFERMIYFFHPPTLVQQDFEEELVLWQL